MRVQAQPQGVEAEPHVFTCELSGFSGRRGTFVDKGVQSGGPALSAPESRQGLQRFIVLFFIDLSARNLEIAGIAQVANGLWMGQIARNLTDAEKGILTGKRYLIHDRDPLFTAEFLNMIADAGVKSVKVPR